MTDETTEFLFVDESSQSQGYKIGYRHDIRSHVRKHTAKRFSERHKTGQKLQPVREKWTPLSSQSLHRQTSNFISQGVELSPLDALLERANIHAGDALKLHNHITQEDFGTSEHFCPYCVEGRCLLRSPKHQNDQRSMVTARTRGKHELNFSPLEFLGSGRTDPFLSYPVEKADRALHELMDFSVTCVTPGLVPDVEPFFKRNTANTVAKSWFSAGLNAPFLFYALAFVASVHRDSLNSSQTFLNSPQALSYKLIVIQKLKEYIAKGSKTCRDEVILTILALADHEAANVTEENRKPFDTPLQTLQWMNVYGSIKCVPEHMKVVLDLIAMRGGIDKIQLPKLAEVIVRGDLVWALHNSSKPVHPPLHIYESYITFVKEWATSSIHVSIDDGKTFTVTFPRLINAGITYTMFEVLDSIRAITMAIDHHLQSKPAGLTLGAIAKTRIAVQQQVLLLPTIKELKYAAPGPNAYECCRLASIIFSLAVLFPIPNTYDVLQTLTRQLKMAVEIYSTALQEVNNSEVHWDLLLWILVFGGIAALDKPERPWYVSELALVVKRLIGIVGWEDIKTILENYLWLESACGRSGIELWEGVEGLVGSEV